MNYKCLLNHLLNNDNYGEYIMPTPAFIAIEGSTQGNITAGAFTEDSVGNVYIEGHEDELMAQAVEHIVTVPTDPQSGQPSGQRVHKAFKFTCSLNKAVPLMYNALASGEMLTNVTVKWFRTSIDGKQEEFFNTVLEDAIIVDMNLVMPHVQDSKNEPFTQLLEVSLSYRKIDWDHTVAGTSGSDDWRTPIV